MDEKKETTPRDNTEWKRKALDGFLKAGRAELKAHDEFYFSLVELLEAYGFFGRDKAEAPHSAVKDSPVHEKSGSCKSGHGIMDMMLSFARLKELKHDLVSTASEICASKHFDRNASKALRKYLIELDHDFCDAISYASYLADSGLLSDPIGPEGLRGPLGPGPDEFCEWAERLDSLEKRVAALEAENEKLRKTFEVKVGFPDGEALAKALFDSLLEYGKSNPDE